MESKKKKKNKISTRDLVFVALFVALIAVCSWITVPSVIPFTLQTFGIFVALGLLGGKRGTVAIFCYIMLGLFGLPVFSGFRGGVSVLAGPTGGYIVGFLVSGLIYLAITHFFGEGGIIKCLSMALGMVAYLAFGTVWFVFVMGKTSPVTVGYALSVCVLPFLPFDCAKIVLALILSKVLGKHMKLLTQKSSNG